jgi:ferric-dicitrate binding protein FerR (iron transport regulator)
MGPQFEIDRLLAAYRGGMLSADEKQRLLTLLSDPETLGAWQEGLIRRFETQSPESQYEPGDLEEMIEDILQHQVKRVGRRVILRWSWAAAVLLFLSVGGYLWLSKGPAKVGPGSIARTGNGAGDILPGTNKAVLTLATGQKIDLDAAAGGKIAREGNTIVEKTAGASLSYHVENVADENVAGVSATPSYNTLTTPRGGQYRLILPDGTKVWLNAASSITYPTAFSGRQRSVKITGEAYFEVTRDAAHAFIVSTSRETVEVLGTRFDVSSYDDETFQRTTLLEGSVRVSASGRSAMLVPGEQARVAGELLVTPNVDLDAAIAWKDGRFDFGDTADIRSVMHQIANWYDVDVVYKGEIHKHLGGTISRQVNLSELLKVLEATGVVRFDVKGRTIEVSPR